MSRLIEKLTNTSRTSSDGDITAQTSTSSLTEKELGSSPSSNKHHHLPWMASTPLRAGPPPRQLLWYRQDALLEAAMEGSLSKLQACFPQSQPMSNIHSVRTVTGLTVLHCAVWSGHLPAVRYLLEEQNLYMDITDWQGGTPLYTLLTKPGKDRIYELYPEKRQAMMDYLLQQGANPYFPWKEEEDLAQEQVCTCGHDEWLEKARQASPYRALFQQCQSRMMLHTPEDKSRQREQTSKPSLLESEQDQQLERYLQLQWKARTATWLVCYNRAETMRFFQPFGKNVSCSYTSLDQVETLWRECQQAHQAWRTSYTAPKIITAEKPQSKPQVAQSKTIHTLLPNAPPMPAAMVATGGGGVSAALEEQEQERLKSKFYKPLPENLSERYKAVLMQRPRLPQDVILRNLVLNTPSSPEKKSSHSPANLSSPSEGGYDPAKDDAKQHLQKALSHLDQSSTSLIQCLISNSNHEFSKFRTQAEATSMATHMV